MPTSLPPPITFYILKPYYSTKLTILKKIFLSLFIIFLFTASSQAQLMVAKMVGKDSKRYGLGYGLFTYFDIPLSSENQSFRIELIDFAFFPTKGEKFFTSTADARGYLSIKLGYKYVFSETQAGFYLIPSAGYCRVVDAKEDQDVTHGDGVAAAMEGGYSLEVGQKGQAINVGIKYEYDRGNTEHTLQAIGLRLSYSFGMFRRKEY